MNNIAEHIEARRSVRTFDGRNLRAKDREELVSFLAAVENPLKIKPGEDAPTGLAYFSVFIA